MKAKYFCLLLLLCGRAPAAELPAVELRVAFPNLTFNHAIWFCESPDNTKRFFIADHFGRVSVLHKNAATTNAELFLDISDRKPHHGNSEEGLLSFAFHPKFKQNHKFYIHYSGHNPRRSIVSEFTVSATNADVADLSSERVLFEALQPVIPDNHKGGTLAFGKDGYLYLGLGDGGTVAGDPDNNGQNINVFLGKILRFDVDHQDAGKQYAVPPSNPFVGRADAKPEIYAYGMRNPWRMSFDRQTGELWVGDVGQSTWEEIDIIKKGGNYGWRLREGFHGFRTNDTPVVPTIDPIAEYPHNPLLSANTNIYGMSITGGYVYRGHKLPHLRGAYVYADYMMSSIFALRYEHGQVTAQGVLAHQAPEVKPPWNIVSFGEDQDGELYILCFDGKIRELGEVEKK